SSVPVRTLMTLTPIRAHITTKANIAKLSKNGKLTEKTPERTEEIVGQVNAQGSAFCRAFGVANCPKLEATEDCHKTSGGSFLCLPKRGTNSTVERAPHTGNLYEMREAAKKVPVTVDTKISIPIMFYPYTTPGLRCRRNRCVRHSADNQT